MIVFCKFVDRSPIKRSSIIETQSTYESQFWTTSFIYSYTSIININIDFSGTIIIIKKV